MPFNLYFAGQQSKDIDTYMQEKNVHRLFSQLNEWKGINDWANNGHLNLFIDSGAFSVHHSGKTVDIDEYIKRINANTHIPIWVELDVIPFPILNHTTARESADKSWENYLYMKQRVDPSVCLLPLYHFGEPKDALKRILNTEVNGNLPEYIGIGGRHGVSTKEHYNYFNEIFSIVKSSDNPNVKIHAFGMTVLDLLEKFPFYSADSTTWLQIGVNGNILTTSGGIVNVSERQLGNKDNLSNMLPEARHKIVTEINDLGYSVEELQKDYKQRLKFNIDYFLRWEKNYKYKGPETFTSGKLF